jgi:hypothetical protein
MRARLADLRRDLAREHAEHGVGRVVGHRPQALGALQADDLRPQVLGLEQRLVTRFVIGEVDQVADVPRLHRATG